MQKVKIVRNRKIRVVIKRPLRYRAKGLDLDGDLLLALRLGYYVRHKSYVSDAEYDQMEKEFLATAPDDHLLATTVGSDQLNSYPPRVRALSLYIENSTWELREMYFRLACYEKLNGWPLPTKSEKGTAVRTPKQLTFKLQVLCTPRRRKSPAT